MSSDKPNVILVQAHHMHHHRGMSAVRDAIINSKLTDVIIVDDKWSSNISHRITDVNDRAQFKLIADVKPLDIKTACVINYGKHKQSCMKNRLKRKRKNKHR